MPEPSQKAAYVLMTVGIQPWKASEVEIALAERLSKEYKYIESAAEELKKILNVKR